ncbi:hypothetical protein [Atopomonas sediminilitoris]|uniref:hypothetical protein n=1 Tax=Atopomonas sediminilitoris TaxID=2919919 RepID=UPI001F4DD934|nr:hypothetical protein [Atopomonas sediminilitoris]MCJ8170194.1 hypothetical protein [Atopomonas sediminilitoris]
MGRRGLLDEDELNFLLEVMDTRLPDGIPRHPQFTVNGGDAGNAMLVRLAASSELQMTALFRSHKLVFPLHLVQDEFGKLTLELRPPRIYEQGPTTRQWRLQPHLPLRLLSVDGEQTTLHIEQISQSGALIHGSNGTPEHLKAFIELPSSKRVPVSAVKVRDIGSQQAAYLLSYDEQEQEDQINSFIFDQHRQQHPELSIDEHLADMGISQF